MNAHAARPTYAGAVAIKRTVAAARKVGIDVAGVEVLPDGRIRVVDARLAAHAAPSLFDELEQKGEI